MPEHFFALFFLVFGFGVPITMGSLVLYEEIYNTKTPKI